VTYVFRNLRNDRTVVVETADQYKRLTDLIRKNQMVEGVDYVLTPVATKGKTPMAKTKPSGWLPGARAAFVYLAIFGVAELVKFLLTGSLL
jgi:hypothetical protein